jgi:hypothetical protein
MKRKSQALRASNAFILQLELPLQAPKRPKSRRELFEDKVDRSAGPLACHPWNPGSKQSNHYGQFWDVNPHTGKRTMRTAHRVAYELHTGQTIPAGKMVLHSRVCRTKLCCNPRHLRLGDARENAADAKAAGTLKPHKLSADIAREVVRLADEGMRRNIIADRYGVCPQSITKILHGDTYSKATGIPSGTKSRNTGRPRKMARAA